MKAMKRLTILLLLMFLLAACNSTSEPVASEQQAAPVAEVAVEATAVPPTNLPRNDELPAPAMEAPAEEPEATSALPETEPMALPEREEVVEAADKEMVEETAVPATEAPVAETEMGVVSGRLEEGAFFLGDPNAPVTLIDYSDFL